MDIPRKEIKHKEKGVKFNVVLFIILVFIIISTSVGAYLNSIEIDMENITVKELFENKFYLEESLNDKEVLLEIPYDGSTKGKFALFDDYIIKCTQNKIDFIDKKGEIKKTFSASFKNPLIKTSGKYLLIVDVKGKGVFVFKGLKKLWEKELDNNIINADINRKGHVAIVHQEERSRNAASIFNNEGNRYFIDKSGDKFVLTANVSPVGDEILLNYANTLGIHTATDLKKYNIESKSQVKKTFENDFFSYVRYIDENTIMAVGDSCITVLDADLKKKWDVSTNGEIYSFDITKGKYIAIAVKTGETGLFNNNESDIFIYDMDGVEVTRFNIEDKMKSLITYDSVIAINSGKKLYIMNSNGKLITEHGFKTEIEHIEFLNKKEILVIVENKVIILNILQG